MFPGSGARSTVHSPVPEGQPDFPVVRRYVKIAALLNAMDSTIKVLLN